MRINAICRVVMCGVLLPTVAWALSAEVATRELAKGNLPITERERFRQAALGNQKAVELLLDAGVDVCTKENTLGSGTTALHFAARQGHVKTVRFLLEHGADVNAVDQRGDIPLREAVGKGRSAFIKLLVEGGAWLDLKGELGDIPLLNAALNGQVASVEGLFTIGSAGYQSG